MEIQRARDDAQQRHKSYNVGAIRAWGLVPRRTHAHVTHANIAIKNYASIQFTNTNYLFTGMYHETILQQQNLRFLVGAITKKLAVFKVALQKHT